MEDERGIPNQPPVRADDLRAIGRTLLFSKNYMVFCSQSVRRYRTKAGYVCYIQVKFGEAWRFTTSSPINFLRPSVVILLIRTRDGEVIEKKTNFLTVTDR